MTNKNVLVLAMVMAALVMEIFAASLTRPEANQLTQEQTPAEDRTFGLLSILALGSAAMKFFSKLFAPAGVTY